MLSTAIPTAEPIVLAAALLKSVAMIAPTRPPKMGPAGPAMMPATASASAPASATAIPLVAPRMLPIVRLVWRARLHVSIRDD